MGIKVLFSLQTSIIQYGVINIVTMSYIRFLELIHLITENLYPFMNLSLLPEAQAPASTLSLFL